MEYGDVDVLTHEAGHGFQAIVVDIWKYLVFQSTMESEIHSMSMEFCMAMDGEVLIIDKYRYSHLVGTVTFIPYEYVLMSFNMKYMKIQE